MAASWMESSPQDRDQEAAADFAQAQASRRASDQQQQIRPINRMTAEMWEDYIIFKAAELLSEWRRKWAAYLPN